MLSYSDNNTFLFVKGEVVTDTMISAYNSLINKKYSALWISHDECKTLTETDKNSGSGYPKIFVCDPFEGPSFEYLQAQQPQINKIYGPFVIIQCIMDDVPIPNWEVPIYSMSMSNMIVCCTNIYNEQKTEIFRKISKMKGEISRDLTIDVTHLITNKVGTKKYIIASQLNIPIYTPSWIDEIWQRIFSDCVSESFDKHKCPIFYGLVISLSQFDADERRDAKLLIENNGGTYTGEMRMNYVTHLILKEASGMKYKYATKWGNIKIVNPHWLTDCVSHNRFIEESAYSFPLTPPNNSSIPSAYPSEATNNADGSKVKSFFEESNGIDVKRGDKGPSQSTPNGTLSCKDAKTDFKNHIEISRISPCQSFIPQTCEKLSQFNVRDSNLTSTQTQHSGNDESPPRNNSTPKPIQIDMDILSQYLPVTSSNKTSGDMSSTLGISSQGIHNQTTANFDNGIHPNPLSAQTGVEPRGSDSTMFVTSSGIQKENVPPSVKTSVKVHIDNDSRHLPIHSGFRIDEALKSLNALDKVLVNKKRRSSISLSQIFYEKAQKIIHKMSQENGLDGDAFPVSAVETKSIPAKKLKKARRELKKNAQLTRASQEHTFLPASVIDSPTSSSSIERDFKDSQDDVTDKRPKRSNVKKVSENSLSFVKNHEPILKGCIIAVSKKLAMNQKQLNKMATDMGAEVKWVYDKSCTHFVYQGKVKDRSKEFRQAQQDNKIIVGPDWLIACSQNGVKHCESLYPYTRDPRLFLSDMSPIQTPYRTNKKSVVKSNRILSSNDTTMQLDPALPENSTINTNFSTLPDISTERRQTGIEQELQDIISKTRTIYQRNRKSKRKLKKGMAETIKNLEDEHNAMNVSRKLDHLECTNRLSANNVNNYIHNNFACSDNSQSQNIQITWEDPVGKREREKISKQLSLLSSTSPLTPLSKDLFNTTNDNSTTNITFKMSENSTMMNQFPKAPPLAFHKQTSSVVSTKINFSKQRDSATTEDIVGIADMKSSTFVEDKSKNFKGIMNECDISNIGQDTTAKPKFMFSALSEEDKIHYGSLIEGLGGTVSDMVCFDPQATHLLVDVPMRTEKYLASIAKGLWVLHKSYLETCSQAGHFIKEEYHEWGSESTNQLIANRNKGCKDLAKAARQWRIMIKASKSEEERTKLPSGAFSSWVVLLYIAPNHLTNIERLLEAGSARVLKYSKINSNPKTDFARFLAANSVTHAFVDVNKMGTQQYFDLDALVKCSVKCLKPEFIPSYLCDPCNVTHENFLLDQLKRRL
ncbi:DNA topoisomerase 2-binding protein 1-like isoform X2 [Gordionus sp. m RMFG-2023]|uniref:DNA topoisomerase 2-binding protein 1-like isoform X2 n=1 Tax=Gordionus sp. m RMFG-2023 TaxID=3053472 RepID=UPI0031FD5F73